MDQLEDLVIRARHGDPSAFDRIVGRVLPEFHRLAVLIVGPTEADDVCQEVLVSVWRELPRLRRPDRFMQWARRALVNRCRDTLRRRARGVRTIDLDGLGPDRSAVRDAVRCAGRDATDGVADRLDLLRLVAALPPAQREVVALHYGGGLSLGEVAAALGVPGGTVKSRLSAALDSMRGAMEGAIR